MPACGEPKAAHHGCWHMHQWAWDAGKKLHAVGSGSAWRASETHLTTRASSQAAGGVGSTRSCRCTPPFLPLPVGQFDTKDPLQSLPVWAKVLHLATTSAFCTQRARQLQIPNQQYTYTFSSTICQCATDPLATRSRLAQLASGLTATRRIRGTQRPTTARHTCSQNHLS